MCVGRCRVCLSRVAGPRVLGWLSRLGGEALQSEPIVGPRVEPCGAPDLLWFGHELFATSLLPFLWCFLGCARMKLRVGACSPDTLGVPGVPFHARRRMSEGVCAGRTQCGQRAYASHPKAGKGLQDL